MSNGDLVTLGEPETFTRIYPHLDEVKDWATNQTLRLLWDRVHDLEGRLKAAEANVTKLGSGVNEVNTTALEASDKAKDAFALAQQPGSALVPPGGIPPDDVNDGGQGAAGCAAAPATGHPGGVVPLSAFEAGKIVCGTGNEFPLLKAPTGNLADRQANAEQLLKRMIWHLQQASFTAGRQRNPSGLISKDKLTVQVDGILRAYDVFVGFDNFAAAMQTQMHPVGPADYVADPGTPD